MAWALLAILVPAFHNIFYFVAFENLRQQNKRIFAPIRAKRKTILIFVIFESRN